MNDESYEQAKRHPNVLLRQARESKGWTQRRLAEVMNIEAQTVSAWERGFRSPGLELRMRLCEVFDMSPRELGLLASDEQQVETAQTQRDHQGNSDEMQS
jgi:transcriptional regulator with XRE-family HTH domain